MRFDAARFLSLPAAFLVLALPAPVSEVYVVGNQPIGADVVTMTFDSGSGTLLGSTGTELVRIDTLTGRGRVVGPIGFSSVIGMAYDRNAGILYGMTPNTLLLIDPSTGAGTPIGSFGTTLDGIAFDGVLNRLYGVRQSGKITYLYLVDRVWGTASSMGYSWLTSASCLYFGGKLAGVTFDEVARRIDIVGNGSSSGGGASGYVFLHVDPIARSSLQYGYCGLSYALEAVAYDPASVRLYGATSGDAYLVDVNRLTGDATLPERLAAGADFGDLQSAIDEAEAGDTILVLPGTYPSFDVDKGVQVVGSPTGPVAVGIPQFPSASFSVSEVPIWQRASISNVSCGQDIAVEGCGGTVVLENVAARTLDIDSSTDVRVHRADVGPGGGGESPFPALGVSASRAEVVGSSVRGQGGVCILDSSYGFPWWECDAGADAAWGEGPESFLHVALTDVLGGPPGAGPSWQPPGGMGFWLSGASAVVAGKGANLLQAEAAPAVSTSSGGSLRYSGITVVGTIAGNASVPAEPDPTLELAVPVAFGDPLAFTVNGMPGASVELSIGEVPTLSPTPNVLVEQLLVPLQDYDLGTVGASGQVTFALDVPWWWPEGALLFAQAELTDPNGEVHRTNGAVTSTSASATVFAAALLDNAHDGTLALPKAAVTTQGNQQALSSFMGQAVAHIQNGEFDLAANRIRKAMERTDGCALGGAPHGKTQGPGPVPDYIVTCEDQARLYPALEAALDLLEQAGVLSGPQAGGASFRR